MNNPNLVGTLAPQPSDGLSLFLEEKKMITFSIRQLDDKKFSIIMTRTGEEGYKEVAFLTLEETVKDWAFAEAVKFFRVDWQKKAEEILVKEDDEKDN